MFLAHEGFQTCAAFPAHTRHDGKLLFVTDGELPATLGPAARKNPAAVLRFHPLTESVLVLSLAIARLKCPFHDSSLSSILL